MEQSSCHCYFSQFKSQENEMAQKAGFVLLTKISIQRYPLFIYLKMYSRLGANSGMYTNHTFSYRLDAKKLKCIEISLSEQTPGAETLSKVCVWTNESSAGSVVCSHWSRHKL